MPFTCESNWVEFEIGDELLWDDPETNEERAVLCLWDGGDGGDLVLVDAHSREELLRVVEPSKTVAIGLKPMSFH